jgi:glycosyltransferase involved in cell wall biosynthesis
VGISGGTALGSLALWLALGPLGSLARRRLEIDRVRAVEEARQEPFMKPAVSVLMPVYNAQRYLAEAVESILAQTFTDFEFLIIDDGSTDRSGEILQGYARRDARIGLARRANTGYCRALNEMLAQARGEFLARMDSDDVALPRRFESQVAYLRARPEVVAVGSRVLLIDDEGCPIREMCTEVEHEAIDRAHLAVRGGLINHPAAMIRAEALRAVQGYRAEFEPGEDVDLWLRLAEIGKLANLPEVLLHYRQHLASIGYARQLVQHRQWFRAACEACRRRGLPEPDNDRLALVEQRSFYDHLSKWAWWALGSGHRKTAWKYAVKALGARPYALGAWKLLACVARGH